MRRHFLLAAAALVAACSSVAPQLRGYQDAAPEELLAAVDKHTYSPVQDGLKRLEADLLIDLAGFIPPKERPTEPVWAPVRFVWDGQSARYSAAKWPKAWAPLEKRVLEMLKGKEEDIVHRPLRRRLQGYRLSVSETEDGKLTILAVNPRDEALRWRLFVNEALHVERIVVYTESGTSDSTLHYTERDPASVAKIASVFTDSGAATKLRVDFDYVKAGKFRLPSKLVYDTRVGQVDFPPLTIQVLNHKAN